MSGRPDRGSGTILALTMLMVIAFTTGVFGALGVIDIDREHAAAAADLAALAAAATQADTAAACGRARLVAVANGGALVACEASEDAIAVRVTLDLDGALAPLGPLTARARAGPWPPGPDVIDASGTGGATPRPARGHRRTAALTEQAGSAGTPRARSGQPDWPGPSEPAAPVPPATGPDDGSGGSGWPSWWRGRHQARVDWLLAPDSARSRGRGSTLAAGAGRLAGATALAAGAVPGRVAWAATSVARGLAGPVVSRASSPGTGTESAVGIPPGNRRGAGWPEGTSAGPVRARERAAISRSSRRRRRCRGTPRATSWTPRMSTAIATTPDRATTQTLVVKDHPSKLIDT
jgi:secretion/DNA translocation related TadE-like protein